MKQATAEQKAAAAARKAKLRTLASDIAAMTDDQRAALINKVGAVVTCEGKPLSLKNTLLCFMQHPAVSMVGGFQQWKEAGRQVRKGEKAIGIWIPSARKGEDGSDDTFFFIGNVFDVSQTDPVSIQLQLAA